MVSTNRYVGHVHWLSRQWPRLSQWRRLLKTSVPLQWRHDERDGTSNHQPHDCFLNGLFRRTSKRTSKLRVTGLCEGNSPVTGEFPAERASNSENVFIWWRHHYFLFQLLDRSVLHRWFQDISNYFKLYLIHSSMYAISPCKTRFVRSEPIGEDATNERLSFIGLISAAINTVHSGLLLTWRSLTHWSLNKMANNLLSFLMNLFEWNMRFD